MKQTSLLKVLSLFLIIGCQNTSPEAVVIATKGTDGNIVSEIAYNEKKQKHGIARFFKKGKLVDEIAFDNDRKNGIHKHFVNGRLSSEIAFKNDIQDGISIWYYGNGNVESRSNWLNGKQFGDAYYYYESGKIKAYRCFDFQAHNRYLIKYDTNQNIIQEQGTLLGQMLLNTQKDFSNVLVNENVLFQVSVAQPPNTDIKVFTTVLVNGKQSNVDTLSVENNIARFKKHFKSTGKFLLLTWAIGKSKITQKANSDSIYTEIIVVSNDDNI